ncbi:MAG TPA: LytR C-terminal domain-containing protein [Acidimicrobiales bacterium]|nr:LytR C-terminal domain-containing protein [Acidimicrobiales bacterium]
MDNEQPNHGASGSLSIVRAAVVLVVFVVAVAVLVAVGTRPTLSSTATTTSTTAPSTSSSTTPTTIAPGGGASTTSTTARSGHHGGTSTTTTTVAPSSVSVVVANATGTNGLAAHYSATIGAGGWSMKTPVDAATTEATSAVYYAAGMQQPAATIATAIGVKPTQVLPITTATPVNGVTGTDVIVVIGQDLATTASASS